MDRRERNGDAQEAMTAALMGLQAGVWTALPGLVQSFNAAKRTCVIQPALRARVQDKDGNYSWISMPLLLDCPVFFPSGGGCTLTFPILPGDECVVVFASRCIDAWWQSGGQQNQAEMRMHDLSDGFVFVGLNSVPKVIASISTSRVQLRSDDGQAFVEIDPSSHLVRVKTSGNMRAEVAGTLTADVGGDVDVITPTKVTLQTPNVFMTGNLTVAGITTTLGLVAGGVGGAVQISNATVTYNNSILQLIGGSISHNGHNIGDTHQHTGVQTGGSNTGPPV